LKDILDKKIPTKGGISGRALKDLSNEVISYIYKKTKGEFIIIGVGGIFSAKDAYEKIKCGASLIQLITGMIYEGPQLISQINLELVELIKKDGYKNISEAIGKNIK
jgi:dihydroorotate dehydrogenase